MRCLPLLTLQPLAKKDKERELKKKNAELQSKVENLEKKCAVLEVSASSYCLIKYLFYNYGLYLYLKYKFVYIIPNKILQTLVHFSGWVVQLMYKYFCEN